MVSLYGSMVKTCETGPSLAWLNVQDTLTDAIRPKDKPAFSSGAGTEIRCSSRMADYFSHCSSKTVCLSRNPFFSLRKTLGSEGFSLSRCLLHRDFYGEQITREAFITDHLCKLSHWCMCSVASLKHHTPAKSYWQHLCCLQNPLTSVTSQEPAYSVSKILTTHSFAIHFETAVGMGEGMLW